MKFLHNHHQESTPEVDETPAYLGRLQLHEKLVETLSEIKRKMGDFLIGEYADSYNNPLLQIWINDFYEIISDYRSKIKELLKSGTLEELERIASEIDEFSTYINKSIEKCRSQLIESSVTIPANIIAALPDEYTTQSFT